VVDWLGYIFNFKDMVKTSKTVASFMNGGLDYAMEAVTHGGVQADAFVDGLKHRFTKDSALQTSQVPGNQDNNGDASRADASKHRDSTPMQWVKYQLLHGGSTSPQTDGEQYAHHTLI